MTTYMKGPFVNLNGATRESLIQQAFDVSSAAETLIQKLGLAAPHGRDYQTQPDGQAFKHDRKLWEMRVEWARAMYDEYRGIGERLYLEGKERERPGEERKRPGTHYIAGLNEPVSSPYIKKWEEPK